MWQAPQVVRPISPTAAWVPANGIHEADLKVLLRSFRAVFPHTSVWFMNSLSTDFLIVVGTHGRSGLNRALQGSVAEEVMRAARCPVLTVRMIDAT